MKKFKQQLSKIINKVKSSRTLQVTITLVISVLLLYHFLFGDIANWNVKIESNTQEIINRGSIYSVFLENDKLKVHEYSRDDLSEKYCKGVADYYVLRRVVSFNPIVVECEAKSVVHDVVITNGLESRTLDYITRSVENFRDIQDGEVIIPNNNNLTFSEIENKYCKKFDLKLRKILNPDPMKVVCGYPDSAKKIYATNGRWKYTIENYDYTTVGQNEQYLVLRNYSLVDKITGEIIKNNIINTKTYKNLNIVGVATLSKNMQFFVSKNHGWWEDIVEIDKTGKETKLKWLFGSSLFKTPFTEDMRANDAGNYLYLIVSKSIRGSNDLYFYIIDTNSKSMIYRKTLESGKSSIGNIYLIKSKENILLIYRLNHTLKTFKIFHKTKKEN